MARSVSVASRLLEEEYARLDRKRDGLDSALKIAERIRKDTAALAEVLQELRALGVERAQIMEVLDLPATLVRAAWSAPAKPHVDASDDGSHGRGELDVRVDDAVEATQALPAW